MLFTYVKNTERKKKHNLSFFSSTHDFSLSHEHIRKTFVYFFGLLYIKHRILSSAKKTPLCTQMTQVEVTLIPVCFI